MTGWTYDKEVNWLKGNRNYDQLKQSQKQLAISELEKIEKTLEEQQFYKKEDTAWCVHPSQINEFVQNQIKSLKEKK